MCKEEGCSVMQLLEPQCITSAVGLVVQHWGPTHWLPVWAGAPTVAGLVVTLYLRRTRRGLKKTASDAEPVCKVSFRGQKLWALRSVSFKHSTLLRVSEFSHTMSSLLCCCYAQLVDLYIFTGGDREVFSYKREVNTCMKLPSALHSGTKMATVSV